VPSNLTTGYGYKISAITTDDNGKTLSDQSDYSFSIISSSTSSTSSSTSSTNNSTTNFSSSTPENCVDITTPVGVFKCGEITATPQNYIDLTNIYFSNSNLSNLHGLQNQSIAPYNESTKTPGVAYYGFTVTDSNKKKVAVDTFSEIDSTGDRTAQIDMLISTSTIGQHIGHPVCPAHPLKIGMYPPGNNPVLFFNKIYKRTCGEGTVGECNPELTFLPLPPATYYITLCNYTPKIIGKFTISWAAYDK